MGGKRGRVFRNNYKGQRQRGVGLRVGGGHEWGGGSCGRKMETTLFKH